MNRSFIYTDTCSNEIECQLLSDYNIDVAHRMPDNKWNVNDTMGIITLPNLILAVINKLDAISLMEISLLHFMCKPILITAKSIIQYPAVEKTVDFVDNNCNIQVRENNFMSWFKAWKDGRWN